MTHKLDSDDFFIHRVQQHCAEFRLNFFLIEPLWVQGFYECCARNEVWARVLLNMHSEHHLPDDIYHRLVLLAHHKGTRVIDPPDSAQAAFDKARMHEQLVSEGFAVPETIVVPQADISTFRLSDEQRALLGKPFVIKPSHGYGRRGVILDAEEESALSRSVSAWPNPSYLLQRRVVPRSLGKCPAYWRAFYVFGKVWICWWNCFEDDYRITTEADWAEFNLKQVEEIIRKVAALTRMQFFSSEIAQVESGEFVLIDYVNDQCHMLSQGANPRMGVPDNIVAAVARQLVESAARMVGRGG